MPINKRVFEKSCAFCEKNFLSAKPFGKFCCDKCRVYYSIEKRAFDANVKDELPSLMMRVKSEMMKLNSEGNVSEQDLDKAISVILKAQQQLDSVFVKLKSFDDYLREKNKKRKEDNNGNARR